MSENTNDIVWDEELLLNPHRKSSSLGRTEGRQAGLKAGYNEGYKSGQHKAMELGLELGFLLGCCRAVAASLPLESEETNQGTIPKQPRTNKARKLRQNVLAIIEDIEAFPTPDDIFARRELLSHLKSDATVTECNEEESAEANEREMTNVDSEGVDVVEKLQRIRAKFKLLTVQLGLPKELATHLMRFTSTQLQVELAAFSADVSSLTEKGGREILGSGLNRTSGTVQRSSPGRQKQQPQALRVPQKAQPQHQQQEQGGNILPANEKGLYEW